MKTITEKDLGKVDPLLKWEHPDEVMRKLLALIMKIGADKFLKGAGLNKERDALIACMYAYAIRNKTRKEYFLQQQNDPPDFNLICSTERALKDKPFDNLNVEIVQIPPTIDKEENKLKFATDLLKRTKLINYKIKEGTLLLIFLNTKAGKSLSSELFQWINQNSNLFDLFGEVYILFLVSNPPEEAFRYVLINVRKNWEVETILAREFNRGILFPHPMIDKALRVVRDDKKT